MKAISDKGFQCYAVGGCVRDAMLGEKPLDWDIATNARLDDLKSIFPGAKVLSEKFSVVRLDYSEDDEEGIIADIATFRKDGEYKDGRRPAEVEFVDEIKEDLVRRDFTINAMADNPAGNFVDPFNGREDMNTKLIRTVGDPKKRFAEDPIRMMRAVRIAAYTNFDIQGKTYEAMLEHSDKLSKCSIDKVRDEFQKIIVGPHAGKGLKMLAGANLMEGIIGEIANNLSRRQKNLFDELMKNIDKTKPILQRRLALFYICIDDKKGIRAAERMMYDSDTQKRIEDAINLNPRLYFMKSGVEIKDFLVKYGPDTYDFVNNFAKADRIVHGWDEKKILGRKFYMDQIIMNGEPIYVEDLAIDGNDLIKAGICREGEECGALLTKLTDIVHRKPKENTKEDLLRHAKRIHKSKFMSATRKVKWSR